MKKFLKQFNVTLSLFLFSLCICLCNFKPYVYAAENKKCSNFTNHTIKPNQSAFFTTIQKKISDNSLDDDVNCQTIEEVEVNEDNSDLESDSDKTIFLIFIYLNMNYMILLIIAISNPLWIIEQLQIKHLSNLICKIMKLIQMLIPVLEW